MRFPVPSLKRTSLAVVTLLAASGATTSCGNYRSSSGQTTGKISFRAFVFNPLQPTSAGNFPVLNIVDASKDLLTRNSVGLSGNVQSGLMALSPNKKLTLVFSSGNNAVAVVDNATQSVGQTSISLPGFTESMFVGADNATAYAAVPSAPVTGQAPGEVEVLNLSNGTISAHIPVPGAHFIVRSHNGNRVLVLGSRADTVTVIAPSLIGTSTDPRTDVQSSTLFDHPVWAVFSSDDTTAYIFNCGAECGGTAAGITVLDLNTNIPGATIPLDSATIGLLSGSTLYVAGTEPPPTPGDNTCTGVTTPTQAATCGQISVVDLGSMTVSGTVLITDGYHNRMETGANGRLFVGAHNCTNINIPAANGNAGEVRGCLSIFDTAGSKVVIPPTNGDVTGIQPITNRTVVYVVQNGELQIYDTTTDKLQSTQVDIIGQAVDVKLVD